MQKRALTIKMNPILTGKRMGDSLTLIQEFLHSKKRWQYQAYSPVVSIFLFGPFLDDNSFILET